MSCKPYLKSLCRPLAKKVKAGTALGLAISRKIVNAHVGEIFAMNNVEGGANFSFLMPIHNEEKV